MSLLKRDYLGKIKNKKEILFFLIFWTVISCFSLFLQKYIINGHDFMFHFSRLEGVITNIRTNNFFNGLYYRQLNCYGYASPLFYSDLFLYIPGILVCMGFSKYFSYKLFLFLISFFSIISMYYTACSISKSKKSGLIAAVLYASSSYRLTDMFERCALGELLTFVFLPLVFLGIYEIIYGDEKKYYLLVFGISGLVLSHLITFVLVFLVLVIICLVNIKRIFGEKRRLLYLLCSVCFTLLITGYFLFPMVEQMFSQKYSVNYMMSHISVLDYATKFYRLFLAIPGIFNDKFFGGGWLPGGLGLAFIFILILMVKMIIHREVVLDNNFAKLSIIICFFCLFFSTNIFPWHFRIIESIFSFIQFPWRILSVVTVLIIISFSIYYANSKYLNNSFITNLIVILSLFPILIYNIYNLSSVYFQDTLGSDFETISFGEYLPVSDVVTDWKDHQGEYYYNREYKAVADGNIDLNTRRKKQYLIVNYENNKDANFVVLPLLYYKGYDIRINHRKVSYMKSDEGLIQVKINHNKGKIVAYYRGTILSYYAKIISLISIVLFVIVVIFQKKRFVNKFKI